MSELVIVEQYGAISCPSNTYKLLVIKTKTWQASKPIILVTAGVHEYETSGVHRALQFVESELAIYAGSYNFIVAPCISPWGYETINRWNPNTIDPNPAFYSGSSPEESINIMNYIDSLNNACSLSY